jgi:ribosome-associated protein
MMHEPTESFHAVKWMLRLREATMGRIEITEDLALDEGMVEVRFTRSGGPGGQKVNKTDSAVQLFLDIQSAGFPEGMLRRLRSIAGGRIDSDGRLMVEARSHRSLVRNRKLAMAKLVKLLRRAALRPKRRKKTAPPRASRERRLREKRKRSEKKRLRRRPETDAP